MRYNVSIFLLTAASSLATVAMLENSWSACLLSVLALLLGVLLAPAHDRMNCDAPHCCRLGCLLTREQRRLRQRHDPDAIQGEQND